MKRSVLAALFLLSVPLYAIQIRSVDDVIRMHRAGVDAELLVAIVQTSRDPFEVTTGDVEAMREAGVPQEVIDILGPPPQVSELPVEAEEPGEAEQPVEADDSTASRWGDWCITFEPPLPIYWPDWSYLPAWLSDPYWYMPRLDGTVASAPPKSQPTAASGPHGGTLPATALPAAAAPSRARADGRQLTSLLRRALERASSWIE